MTSSTAAMFIAVGNVSFDDCDMFTWSFGWIGVLLPRSPPGDLDRPVRDHLVDVHVRLGAGAGLPDVEREVVVELAGDDLVGRLADQVRVLVGELAEVAVHHGGGLLEHRHRPDHRVGHPVVGDREVVQRPLGLRTPVAVVARPRSGPCCRSRCGSPSASAMSPPRRPDGSAALRRRGIRRTDASHMIGPTPRGAACACTNDRAVAEIADHYVERHAAPRPGRRDHGGDRRPRHRDDRLLPRRGRGAGRARPGHAARARGADADVGARSASRPR